MSDRRMQSSRDERRQDRDDPRDRRDRRRSRSPGHRGNRRDFEADRYSSSRDFREREREERYSDRRDWGDWGRRRDTRRDDDDRRRDHRRERGGGGDDLFSDRRRGPRDDRARRDGDRDRDRDRDRERDGDRGRDRDDMRQLERQAARPSASPPRKPKEPTPDLTDVTSILERSRRMTQWDIKPPGYENVSAETAKLSGMFPLPGAPRQQPMDVSRLQAFMNQPGNQASSTALKPSSSRQSKRLILTNTPQGATEEGIMAFFNQQLNGLNITRGQDPCTEVHASDESTWYLVEFKSNEDATMALTLDGVSMGTEAMDTTDGHSNGTARGLQLKRPKDYIAPAVSDESQSEPGTLPRNVPDTQNKIAVTNIPVYISEEQIIELLVAFGELRSFILVKDDSTEANRGTAFCEYKDTKVTNAACEHLNGMELGETPLKVQRASIGIQQVGGEMSVNAMSLMAGSKGGANDSSRVICLMNMITHAELMDTDEADEILEDVTLECQKFGEVSSIKMPRPISGSRVQNGLGKIYVRFATPENAAKALAALAGRKFSDRTVVATYYPEEYFAVDAWYRARQPDMAPIKFHLVD